MTKKRQCIQISNLVTELTRLVDVEVGKISDLGRDKFGFQDGIEAAQTLGGSSV
jgi:hypothetical protein